VLAHAELDQVLGGLYRLTNGCSNFYLVEEQGKAVVVDAGTPRDWKRLVRSMARLHRTLEDIEAVLLTHAHPDHTGFAERARREAQATVWIQEADAEAARSGKVAGKRDGSMRPYLFRGETYRTLAILMTRGGGRIVPIATVSTFRDGEQLDVPGHPIVVHAPGHSPGSAALWFKSSSVLCTGDTLVTRNPLTGRLGPQVMPSALNADTGQALDSLRRLEAITAQLVLPGHGEVWNKGTADAVGEARRAGRS
jgi:glyoxylase-like metal-dependent hydrolase (beta-lactamase superfamily II)